MGTKHLMGFVGLGLSQDAVMALGGALLGAEPVLSWIPTPENRQGWKSSLLRPG